MANKRYYTQLEVDEYVRKLLTDSEIALSKQSEKLAKAEKENEILNKDLEETRLKEKTNARLLVLSERKAKNLENAAKEKSAKEVDRLARLFENMEQFFATLEGRCSDEENQELDDFKDEVSSAIDSLIEIQNLFGQENKNEEVVNEEGDINRLNILRQKKQSELDDRFSKLVLEFNMKIGDNATRGRGRPKKQDSTNVKDIKKKLESDKKDKPVYPPKGESGFDFEEALNPVDSLEDIMKDLMN